MHEQCVRPTKEWVSYFQHNAQVLLELPWNRGAELTDAEREAIAESLQEFQLGESSDGSSGRRLARLYAERTGDFAYAEAIALFIKEEQRHGGDLGRFLELAQIPRLGFTWRDSVFRFLRRGFGLEMLIVSALTAELIAKVYYRAIHDATNSPLLRRLCAQILRDEKAHVRFHFERFAVLRRHRPHWVISLCHGLQRFLYAGTCLVVWSKHGQAFRAGGYGWHRYWSACWHEFREAVRQMEPANYKFDAARRFARVDEARARMMT